MYARRQLCFLVLSGARSACILSRHSSFGGVEHRPFALLASGSIYTEVLRTAKAMQLNCIATKHSSDPVPDLPGQRSEMLFLYSYLYLHLYLYLIRIISFFEANYERAPRLNNWLCR